MDCGGKHPCLSVGWGSPHLQSPRRRCRVRRQVSDDHVTDSPADERDDSRPDSEGGASPTLHPEHAGFWLSPGRAGFDIVPSMPFRLHATLRTMSNRATLAVYRSGASAPATRQAAGVPSARSQSFNHQPRDRAEGATLGRPRHEPRRTRRPALLDAEAAAAAAAAAANSIPRLSTWASRAHRGVPGSTLCLRCPSGHASR